MSSATVPSLHFTVSRPKASYNRDQEDAVFPKLIIPEAREVDVLPMSDLGNNGMGSNARENKAQDLAAQGLAALKAGNLTQGLALYRQGLRAIDGSKLPLGLHAAMLRQGGQAEAAEAIETLGVLAGADPCLSACLSSVAHERIAAEYRERFARGQVNAMMVSRYLTRLSRIGDVEAMRPWTDPALVRCIPLAGSEPDAIAGAVRARLKAEHWHEASQSIARSATFEIARDCDPVLERLFGEIRAHVLAYADDAADSITGAMGWIPDSFATRAWAVISHGDGFNHRHIHPQAWLTAVYYPAFPQAGAFAAPDAGFLKLGPPDGIADDAPGWLRASIRPYPGLLVLFPAWITHWTVPVGEAAERISLPIDINDIRFRNTGYAGGRDWHRNLQADRLRG